MLFRILGKSRYPLSSYQIKKEMEKAGMQESGSPYVYAMIDELVPKSENKNYIFLFAWNRLPRNKKEKESIVKTLNSFYNLGWTLDSEGEVIQFRKGHDNKTVTIENESSNTVVKIERDSSPYSTPFHADLSIIDNDIERGRHGINIMKEGDKVVLPLRMKYESLPPMRYLDENYRDKIEYLNHDLDSKSEYLKSKLLIRLKQLSKPSKQVISPEEEPYYQLVTDKPTDEGRKTSDEISKLDADRRKWRYSLNIRGLVKYLLGEIELQKIPPPKIHNKRISKVLENLSHYYAEEFPFLMYYSEFKNEYDHLRVSAELPKYYEVELLKQIAQELQYQVDRAPIDFLKYWVTRRYSGELTYYFISAGWSRVMDDKRDLRYLSFKKIHDYQASCLYVMKQYLESEAVNINRRYEMYQAREYPNIYF
jgi:hypothetical protein